MSTLTPRSRSFVAVIALAVALAAVAAACGIDGDKVATGSPTSVAGHSTTSKPGGPQISLPDIPSDVTESTVPDPTTSSVPESEATPNGITPDDLAQQLLATGQLNEDQAQCVATGTFAEFDGATIDQMIAANDLADLGGDIEQRFTEIIQTCLQGG